MTALAAYNSLVTCATGAAGTFVTMQGIKSLKIGDSRDLLDVTDFADGNIRARISALRDIKLDLSGDFETADPGWLRAFAAYQAGDDFMVNVYTSAVATTSGFSYVMKIGSFDINGAVDGKLEVSMSLMTNATSASIL